MTARRFAAIGLIAIAAVLGGCSQAAALAPVGGDRVVSVRVATIEVLLERLIDVREAPACHQDDDAAVSCTGTTSDGLTVSAAAMRADLDRVIVQIDGDTVYDGSIDAVLEQAASMP